MFRCQLTLLNQEFLVSVAADSVASVGQYLLETSTMAPGGFCLAPTPRANDGLLLSHRDGERDLCDRRLYVPP